MFHLVFALLFIMCCPLAASPSSNTTEQFSPQTSKQPGTPAHLRPLTPWSLERLIAEALLGNPDIYAKRATYEGAEATVDANLWQFFPAPYVQLQKYSNSLVDSQSYYVVGLKQPLFTGGKLVSSLKAARASATSSNLSIYETRYALAVQITNAYQYYMQYRGREKAQQDAVKRLEAYAVMMKNRVTSGISAVVEMDLVTSRLLQARSDLRDITTNKLNYVKQLQQLVNNSVNDTNLLLPETETSVFDSSESLLQQAYKHSPLLQRLEADIQSAEHQVNVQKSVFWPTINLKAEYQNAVTTRVSGMEDARAYITVEFAPGAGLSSFSSLKAAKSKVSSLSFSRESAKRELTTKVRIDYDESKNAFIRLQTIRSVLQSSNNVLESYNRLFTAGKRSWLDVLNAARELTQMEQLYSDTKAQLITSTFRIKLHTGEIPLLRAPTE